MKMSWPEYRRQSSKMTCGKCPRFNGPACPNHPRVISPAYACQEQLDEPAFVSVAWRGPRRRDFDHLARRTGEGEADHLARLLKEVNSSFPSLERR